MTLEKQHLLKLSKKVHDFEETLLHEAVKSARHFFENQL